VQKDGVGAGSQIVVVRRHAGGDVTHKYSLRMNEVWAPVPFRINSSTSLESQRACSWKDTGDRRPITPQLDGAGSSYPWPLWRLRSHGNRRDGPRQNGERSIPGQAGYHNSIMLHKLRRLPQRQPVFDAL